MEKTREATPAQQMVEQFTDDELLAEYKFALGAKALSLEYIAILEDEHFKRNLGHEALMYLVQQSEPERV